MSRGRPSEQVEKLDKWTIESTDYEGVKSIIKFDKSKSPNGPYSFETTFTKPFKLPKIEKRAYGGLKVYIAFKTSNRSNAKTKIKGFNQSIDYILTQDKLPGIPKKAIILDIGVGESFKQAFINKYT